MIFGTMYKSNFFSGSEFNHTSFYLSGAILLCGSLLSESSSVSILNKVISPTM